MIVFYGFYTALPNASVMVTFWIYTKSYHNDMPTGFDSRSSGAFLAALVAIVQLHDVIRAPRHHIYVIRYEREYDANNLT